MTDVDDGFRWRLAFARRLLHRAARIVEEPSPFAPGEALMTAQDGVEILLRALYVPPSATKKDASFFELVSGIEAAKPFAGELLRLNDLRVGTKHHGNAADRTEARRRVADALVASSAISRATPPNLDVQTVFLGSWLRNRLAADALVAAEQIIERADSASTTDEFLDKLATAQLYARIQARAALPFDVTAPLKNFEASARRSSDQVDKGVGRAMGVVAESFDRVVAVLLAREVSISVRDLTFLETVLPSRQLAADGSIVGISSATTPSLTGVEKHELLVCCVRYAEGAEAVDQVRLGSGQPLLRATRAAKGLFGDGDTVVATLEPDALYVEILHLAAPPGFTSIWLCGLMARAPADALQPVA